MLSRRTLLRLVPATAGGLLLPGALRADAASERKFLFVFCPGGWDPAWALAPVFGGPADMPEGAVLGSQNGIDYVDNPMSPAVGAFFARWGHRACLIHGIEARSVAHDVCLRLLLTGSALPGVDDWPIRLAAASSGDFTMPYVNLSGPTYAGGDVGALVRLGENGQLAALLDGSAVDGADLPAARPSEAVSALTTAALTPRLERWIASAGRGREATIARGALVAESRLDRLRAVSADLDLASGTSLSERAAVALSCLERGLSRVGMVEFYGHLGLTWDTHGVSTNQGAHFQDLFAELSLILDDLSTRAGSAGGSLADETTVVVMSEMGRYPRFNAAQGKEHWTWTSCLLLGSGVRGGQSIGGYDLDTYLGVPVNLTTGEPGDTPLNPNHLGATLLALGGHDPGALLDGAEPIGAALEDA